MVTCSVAWDDCPPLLLHVSVVGLCVCGVGWGGTIPDDAQGLLLTLLSEITPNSARGTIWDTRDRTVNRQVPSLLCSHHPLKNYGLKTS